MERRSLPYCAFAGLIGQVLLASCADRSQICTASGAAEACKTVND